MSREVVDIGLGLPSAAKAPCYMEYVGNVCGQPCAAVKFFLHVLASPTTNSITGEH